MATMIEPSIRPPPPPPPPPRRGAPFFACQRPNGAPSGSVTTAIRPASMTSNGSIAMLPPASRTLDAVSSALSTQKYMGPHRHRRCPLGDRPDRCHVEAARRHEVLARRLGRHRVLELPSEEAAVELGRGLRVGLTRIHPAGHTGDVSVTLGIEAGHVLVAFGHLLLPLPIVGPSLHPRAKRKRPLAGPLSKRFRSLGSLYATCFTPVAAGPLGPASVSYSTFAPSSSER